MRTLSSVTCNIPENAPMFRSNSAFFWMNEKMSDTSSEVAYLTFIA
ncbi:hypothetical protein GXM_10484 [Nostoc sphaeroides CCNUC1]|uniref:Uncharacterized protein n=1 Tax=Nostoc sphaeroides CCNUC1 TaxID=2653204 RepID=A0A5P8WLG8_9NOSO|nr:hypothetical protein GXM_10484 [Nostoc sphaeroides CCNUC1]